MYSIQVEDKIRSIPETWTDRVIEESKDISTLPINAKSLIELADLLKKIKKTP